MFIDKRLRYKFAVVFIFLFLMINLSYSTVIIINSQDWRDVYHGLMYGRMTNASKILFFVHPSQYATMHLRVPRGEDILLFESVDKPFVDNYASILSSKGFTNITVRPIKDPTDFSISLAKDLNIRKFIVIGDEVGYPSVSVAPYALATDSWVLFVNERNIDQITSFLSQVHPVYVMVYGTMPPSVEDQLQSYTTERINRGSRFDNNLEIVKKMTQLNPSNKQLTLTNGEFLEESLFDPKYPVLLIGRERTPDQVITFLKSSNYTYATLIGQELFDVARKLKDDTPLEHVFVKYGKALVGYNDKGEMIKTLVDLDKFPVPVYDLRLAVENVRYNVFDHKLYVTYHNLGNSTVFFRSNIIVKGAGSDEMITVSDDSAKMILPHRYYYERYDVDLRDLIDKFDELSLEMTTLYGEDYNALNLVLHTNIDHLTIFKFEDNSNITIGNVYYVYSDKQFYVEVKNNWDQTSYVRLDLTYTINGQNRTISSDIIEVPGGQTLNITLPEILTRDTAQALDGAPVTITGNYGGIKEFLQYDISETRPLQVILPPDYMLWLLILLIIILLAYIAYKKWQERSARKDMRKR